MKVAKGKGTARNETKYELKPADDRLDFIYALGCIILVFFNLLKGIILWRLETSVLTDDTEHFFPLILVVFLILVLIFGCGYSWNRNSIVMDHIYIYYFQKVWEEKGSRWAREK